MKKIMYLLLVLLAAVGLSACSQQEQVKEPDTKKVVEKPTKEEPAKEEPANPDVSGSDDQDKENNPGSNDQEKTYQNEAFKDVMVVVSGDQVVVTGKAQVFEGVFQYGVYDGKTVLLEDRYQTAGAPAWGDFKITFGADLIRDGGVRLELFVYSAKDGAKVNVLKIPVRK
ncbi:Gmad2 immunoglobulin-like domain-containing protein [Neobacillus soli]|uniref:Gmad2 immunoglobulin-like domain-containing protein n=1 Tax=Neobacillus soli TaxID=220688 RepID=UPI0008246725|nr:Gmad2 immunoglobulin-like domain-containing protein [Neobacillus soli]